MNRNKNELKILGLSSREAKILVFLEQRAHITVSNLARSMRVPRTTISFLLRKLQERGYTEKISVKNHKEWKLVSRENMTRKFREAFYVFGSHSDVIGSIIGSDIGIEVYRGKKNIEKTYHRIFQVSKSDRVYAVQGNRSVELSLQKIQKEYFFNFHEKFKQKEVIMEGIIGESGLELLRQLSVEELHSHVGRMTVVYVVPDQYVDFDLDIIFFSNFVFLINMEKEQVIFIQNNALVKALHGLLHLAQKSGRKIDLNRYIKELIEKRKSSV